MWIRSMVFLRSLTSRLLLLGWVSVFLNVLDFRALLAFVLREKSLQAVLMILLFEDVITGF
jgi:hypothetical protein